MGVGLDHLQGLYAETSDPWGFEHSAYEQAKFAATPGTRFREKRRSRALHVRSAPMNSPA